MCYLLLPGTLEFHLGPKDQVVQGILLLQGVLEVRQGRGNPSCQLGLARQRLLLGLFLPEALS